MREGERERLIKLIIGTDALPPRGTNGNHLGLPRFHEVRTALLASDASQGCATSLPLARSTRIARLRSGEAPRDGPCGVRADATPGARACVIDGDGCRGRRDWRRLAPQPEGALVLYAVAVSHLRRLVCWFTPAPAAVRATSIKYLSSFYYLSTVSASGMTCPSQNIFTCRMPRRVNS